MGGEYGTHVEENYVQPLCKILKERGHMKGLGVNGNTLLKLILKSRMKAWTGFSLSGEGQVLGWAKYGNELSCFKKFID
jgi:hypothetical protein